MVLEVSFHQQASLNHFPGLLTCILQPMMLQLMTLIEIAARSSVIATVACPRFDPNWGVHTSCNIEWPFKPDTICACNTAKQVSLVLTLGLQAYIYFQQLQSIYDPAFIIKTGDDLYIRQGLDQSVTHEAQGIQSPALH